MKRAALLIATALFACVARSDPIFESVVRSDMRWKISARLAADDRPVTICQLTLYDVLAGERIHMEGWTQVDALTTAIGVNVQMAYCDDGEPQCNYSGRRWPGASVHKWAAGNVWRKKGEHHKIYTPSADYVNKNHQQAITFRLFVNIYSNQPAGAYAGINDCAVTFERHRGD